MVVRTLGGEKKAFSDENALHMRGKEAPIDDCSHGKEVGGRERRLPGGKGRGKSLREKYFGISLRALLLIERKSCKR